MAKRSKATERQCIIWGTMDVLRAAQLCCGPDKAFMKQLGAALEAVRVYDPRDPGVLLRQDIRDLAEELLEYMYFHDFCEREPEPF